MIATPENAPHRTTGLRILLAEDGLVAQQVAVRLLERNGHCVTVAANGREALELLECREFDLVLMDIHMPEMDGLEATSVIRSRESDTGGHIPIVAVTSGVEREQCLAAGMDAYIAKPLRPDSLDEVLPFVLGL